MATPRPPDICTMVNPLNLHQAKTEGGNGLFCSSAPRLVLKMNEIKLPRKKYDASVPGDTASTKSVNSKTYALPTLWSTQFQGLIIWSSSNHTLLRNLHFLIETVWMQPLLTTYTSLQFQQHENCTKTGLLICPPPEPVLCPLLISAILVEITRYAQVTEQQISKLYSNYKLNFQELAN